jgi:hypothetical protein
LLAFWVWLIFWQATFNGQCYAFVSEVWWTHTLNTNVLSFWAHIIRPCFEGKTTFRLIVVIHWSESFYFPFFQLQNRRQRCWNCRLLFWTLKYKTFKTPFSNTIPHFVYVMIIIDTVLLSLYLIHFNFNLFIQIFMRIKSKINLQIAVES